MTGISPELLDRYLSGTAGGHERAVIQGWLASRTENSALLEVLSAMDVSGRPEFRTSGADRTGDWNRLLEQMDGNGGKVGSAAREGLRAFDRHSASRLMGYRRSIAIAAVALVAAVVVFKTDLLPKFGTASQDVEVSYATKVREIRRVQLAPGISTVLAPGSSAKFHSLAGRNEVYIDGEAMFAIEESAVKAPLIVRSDDAEARVLGTKFSVRAFKGERGFRVVVADGKVGVSRGTASEVLSKGDVIRISGDGVKELYHNKIAERYMRFADGRLAFVNAPLDEVAADLSRWFGVEVRLTDPALADEHFTANFGPEGLEFVLQALESTMPVRIQRKGNVHLLVPKV